MKTEILAGLDLARGVAALLVDCSVWFEVTPLPDDEWEFKVKDDAALALQHTIDLERPAP